MSGLVTGLQNRARRFESARHLPRKQRIPQRLQTLRDFFFATPLRRLQNIGGQRIFPVGMAIFKNKELSLPYEIRSATSRHPSGCAYRQL